MSISGPFIPAASRCSTRSNGPWRSTADALDASREVLRKNGNMSSATVMFVLAEMLAKREADQVGCAMAFGPGLTAETMMFHTADAA